MKMAGIDIKTGRPSPVNMESGDQLSKLALKGEKLDKGHNWLREGITESRNLPMPFSSLQMR